MHDVGNRQDGLEGLGQEHDAKPFVKDFFFLVPRRKMNVSCFERQNQDLIPPTNFAKKKMRKQSLVFMLLIAYTPKHGVYITRGRQ